MKEKLGVGSAATGILAKFETAELKLTMQAYLPLFLISKPLPGCSYLLISYKCNSGAHTVVVAQKPARKGGGVSRAVATTANILQTTGNPNLNPLRHLALADNSSSVGTSH